MTNTKSCYHSTAVEQAVGEKIVVQLFVSTEWDRGVGRPEHGRRTWQGQPAGNMQWKNVEGRKEDEKEREGTAIKINKNETLCVE